MNTFKNDTTYLRDLAPPLERDLDRSLLTDRFRKLRPFLMNIQDYYD